MPPPTGSVSDGIVGILEGCSLEGRQDLPLVEAEEALLILADLMHRDMIESGVHVLLDRGSVTLRVRTAGDGLRDILLADRLGGLLEMTRKRQLLAELAGDAGQ